VVVIVVIDVIFVAIVASEKNFVYFSHVIITVRLLLGIDVKER
jgi:hypothetical protein